MTGGVQYRMSLEVYFSTICLGAFEVSVFDHIGELTITDWGKEIPCSKSLRYNNNNNGKRDNRTNKRDWKSY